MTEKEQIEKLLLPRFEVIADYPNSQYKVGDILDGAQAIVLADNFRKYPHLFRELKWWEKRGASELPEYFNYKGSIFKVKKWNLKDEQGWIVLSEGGNWYYRDSIQPATEAEYEKGKIKN